MSTLAPLSPVSDGAGRLMMGDTTYNHVFSDTAVGDLTRRLAAGEMTGTGDLLACAGPVPGDRLGSFPEEVEDEAPLPPGTSQGENALDALLGAMMDNMDPRSPAADAQDTPTGALQSGMHPKLPFSGRELDLKALPSHRRPLIRLRYQSGPRKQFSAQYSLAEHPTLHRHLHITNICTLEIRRPMGRHQNP